MGSLSEDIKQATFRNTEQKAGINIMYTANWLRNRVALMLKPHGLSPEQYNVLRILRGQNGVPASVKMVNERMLDPMSNVSRLVDKLFNSGLVERKICPSDRRQVELLLTSNGIRSLEEADESLKELGNIFSGISEERLELLNEILDQLRSEKL